MLTTCASCHDGSKATGRPANHIVTPNATQCATCHLVSTLTGFKSFAGGQMENHLREKHKVTSIVVTHEMESAFAVATRMAFLHEGKIILEGTPDEFRDSDDPAISDFLLSYSNHEKAKE